MQIAAGNMAPNLGVAGFPEEDVLSQQGLIAEAPGMLERMHNLFSTMAERVGDVAEQVSDRLPTPSAERTARLLGGTLALAAVLPGVAEGKIVIGQSIGGVKLGETQPQVQATLGQPSGVNTAGNQGSAWFYSTKEINVGFSPGLTVDSLVSFSPKQKTDKGIGAGSSLQAMRKAYPQAKCKSTTVQFGPGSEQCTIKTRYQGKPVLTFLNFLKPKAASEIDVEFASVENH
jgi:outer membrane protein assembly factor BamE (lipoprotein component of BamABCDE complex)